MVLKYFIGRLFNILGIFKLRFLPNIRLYLTDLNDNLSSELNIAYCSTKDGPNKIQTLCKINSNLFFSTYDPILWMVINPILYGMTYGIIQIFEYLSKCNIFVSRYVSCHPDNPGVVIVYHFWSIDDEALKSQIGEMFKSLACVFWKICRKNISINWVIEKTPINNYSLCLRMFISLKIDDAYDGVYDDKFLYYIEQFCKYLNEEIVFRGFFSIPSFKNGFYGNC